MSSKLVAKYQSLPDSRCRRQELTGITGGEKKNIVVQILHGRIIQQKGKRGFHGRKNINCR
ncbi:hypothetical protein [Desulfocicer niacini]